MIIAFSTSCALASVAVIDRKHGVLWEADEYAPQGASGACLKMLGAAGARLEDAELFAADIGPGSFTGVRVGVTLAKTFGYLFGRPVAGVSSFDLVSADAVVVFPSKKNEFFIRRPGVIPIRSVELPNEPFIGFGPGVEPQVFPRASRLANSLDRLVLHNAMSFVPEYLIEPSISVPKKSFHSSAVPIV